MRDLSVGTYMRNNYASQMRKLSSSIMTSRAIYYLPTANDEIIEQL